MNLDRLTRPVGAHAFRTWRSGVVRAPGGRIQAFGSGKNQIGSITVINLDRQPRRWSLVTRELGRFRTSEGLRLTAITRRLAAVDARDGRSTAATSDVDAMYRVGDQLHVQPDDRLARCFSENEPVRMTRQEVAVARSHVEAWKAAATGTARFTLVLEDDVWFSCGARSAIDRGWSSALRRCSDDGGPKLFYLSYSDAGGTADRREEFGGVFRPVRGLWFLSGYVLSRDGAAALLQSMPVVGPVDLWMNFQLAKLGALALSSPAISQRRDVASDNAYSMLPYLARAGVIDGAQNARPPGALHSRAVLSWTSNADREPLAMALSMLGLRVRVFDGDEPPMDEADLAMVLREFDAAVNAPLGPSAAAAVSSNRRMVLLLEDGRVPPDGLGLAQFHTSRSAVLSPDSSDRKSWDVLADLLGVVAPVDSFPAGAPRSFRVFRDDRASRRPACLEGSGRTGRSMDDSPWVLPLTSSWQPAEPSARPRTVAGQPRLKVRLTQPSTDVRALVETFPGNLAYFAHENLEHNQEGVQLTIDAVANGSRPFRSGAFASVGTFRHGRFEVEIRAAAGPGLVTGFFLRRDNPLQEIDVEFPGSEPWRMLVNVFFNPGDDGSAMSFGYRGSPCWVDLGFDATKDFHRYAIDWRPGYVAWLVDGCVVHERVGWDPTPIPHLAMRVHANLWAPRSDELAGRLDEQRLPAVAAFRNLSVLA